MSDKISKAEAHLADLIKRQKSCKRGKTGKWKRNSLSTQIAFHKQRLEDLKLEASKMVAELK